MPAARVKRWPYVAKEARDNAIMDLTIADQKLIEVVQLDGGLSEMEKLRLLALAMGHVKDARRWLESVQ